MSAAGADGLYVLRLVAALTSLAASVGFLVSGGNDLTILLALLSWNLACLGLYRWPAR
jgi:hypothetical protein